MAIDRNLVLHLAAQRAGFTESQLDALRRRDYTALLTEKLEQETRNESADLQRTVLRLETVRQQRDAALNMLHQLAARLGCCGRCWGADATCATCAGRGSPGHFPPDPHLREWLGPALAYDAHTP
jgi:dienelactone hydrolase